jgi:hypothetical protein
MSEYLALVTIRENTNNIMIKALRLFSSLKENKFKGDTTIFSASGEWFEKLKTRTGTHDVRLTWEAASTDKDAAIKFPARFKKFEEIYE